MSSNQQSFGFTFEDRYRRPARLFGIREDTTVVTVAGTALLVRFGPWRLVTNLSNVAEASITGPYRFLTTAGQARLSAENQRDESAQFGSYTIPDKRPHIIAPARPNLAG